MRYLKITLSGAALFLVYLWITILLNSCNSNNTADRNVGSETELLEEEMEGSDFISDEFEGGDEDNMYAEKPGSQDDAGSMDESSDEGEDEYESGDYTSSNEKTKRFPANATSTGNTSLNARTKTTTSKSSSTASASYSSNEGKYFVIAGSYLLEENANKMVRKLQGMGYSNAEIVHFDQSQYHSICAGKYDSNSSAARTASTLKNAGIDSYVHRRQN